VLDLAVAYTQRHWDDVRRINTKQAGFSDAKFEQVYGRAGAFPRLEEDHHWITTVTPVDPAHWAVTGAIVAWDYLDGGVKSTNVACARWDVDAIHGTAPVTGVQSKDGRGNQRLEGWLPASDFGRVVASFCG